MATLKVKYVGDPLDKNSGPDENTMHGIRFVKGEVTEIPVDTDKQKLVAERISRSRHFVVGEAEPPKPPRPPYESPRRGPGRPPKDPIAE